MKKEKCVICSQRKGKRRCKLRNNEIICSLCCVEYRDAKCVGCLYYETAKQYALSKVKQPKPKLEPKHFIAEIRPEVEKKVNHALALVEKGAVEEGEKIIYELQKNYPGNYTIYYGLGVVHALKKQYDKAIEYFDRAIDIFPYCIEAHFNKGVAYKNKFEINNMIKAFKEVIDIGNSKSEIVKNARNFIEEIEQGIKDRSGIDLETYLEGEKIFNQAFSCMQKHQWQNAIDGFKACLLINPKHAQSYGNIGACYAQLGQKEQALSAFDKALEIDPNYEPALINRMAVESWKEGERLAPIDSLHVEYYKDYPLKKKSLIQSIFQKFGGRKEKGESET
ncbi:MAG: tetratricopeptide repeat protein [bacterium]